jgi:asparagine synthase (glutamine-hydrolysing)
MCGIAGTIGIADRQIIEAMTAALRHRGPDDGGTALWPEAPLALGHRRLAIIDLSAAGHQPMTWASGRYAITYNGEVYNYRELRQELERRGCVFHTQTDTEVVLAAYATWGEGCLERFRGMFALAIADFAERSVFLARDRFGIKPLLYAAAPGRLLFASELRALRASGLVSNTLDRQAIRHYLSLGAMPAPRTILAEARALLPGQALSVGFEGTVRRSWRWWDLVSAARAQAESAARLDFAGAAAGLREQLEAATRYHLVADVPVGAFLSGGVDSAAMIGLMSRLAGEPIRTFTVGFEAHHAGFSESASAAETARHFGTRHTEVILTDSQAAASFDALLAALDQPSADGANTWFVAQAAAREVKVVLTGLGGDELFAGYPHFRRHALAAVLSPAGSLVQSCLSPLRWLPDRCRHSLMLPALTLPERLATLRCLLGEREKPSCFSAALAADRAAEPLEALYAPGCRDGLDSVAQLSVTEIEGYLARTLLRDGDVMSMAHSLEARPILLDHVLAAYAFALPSSYKVRQGRGKAVFVEALRDLLPEAVLQRPKRGFELPLLRWLRGPLRETAEEALRSDTAAALFSAPFLSDARRRLQEPRPRDHRLWPYVVLIEWVRRSGASL